MKIIFSIAITLFVINVQSQTTTILDSNFEQYLITEGYDAGVPDGSVPTANIIGVTILDMNNLNIGDLTGIEDFPALTYLDCGNNQLSAINVLNNINLITLICAANQITSIDVTQNIALFNLDCSFNQLTSLNVTNNNNLETLACDVNQITNLDLSQNTELKILSCTSNNLSNLELSSNDSLWTVNCFDNQISSLDLSENSVLSDVWCSNNQLECLNVKNGNNINMTGVQADNNPNLSCIEVDDTSTSSFWVSVGPPLFNFDNSVGFSTDCGNACSALVSGIPAPGNHNTLKVYPNPAIDILIIDNGDYVLMTGHNLKIVNGLGQDVFNSAISTPQFLISINTIGPSGTYFIQIIDPLGQIIDTRKLILN